MTRPGHGPGVWMGLISTVLVVALGVAAAGPAGLVAEADRLALARIERPPLGLPPVPVPAENLPTAAKIALGRKLFFDRRLSANGTMSCAMCHVPEQGFTNNELATPIGVEGRSLRRNAPTTLNAAYAARLFHDGRETSLETQALAPLIARDEMANPSLGLVVARLTALSDYHGLFEAVFGGGPTADRIGQAIASWERSLLAGDSPFDRWRYRGEEGALTAEQERGYELFIGRAGCAACHSIGPDDALFTDGEYHDTGIGYRRDVVRPTGAEPVTIEVAPGVSVSMSRAVLRTIGNPPHPDAGRLEVTRDPRDRWRFRTPSLRNVALTAPYMHDGSLRTLEEVVRYYDGGGEPHPGQDPRIRPLGLSDEEVHALAAFLEALTARNIAELVADARSAAIGN